MNDHAHFNPADCPTCGGPAWSTDLPTFDNEDDALAQTRRIICESGCSLEG